MSPIMIYGMAPSAPFRIVTMTCEILGLQYEVKPVNILEGENKKPEYLKVMSFESSFCLTFFQFYVF